MEFVLNGNVWCILFVDPCDYNLIKPDGTFSLGCTDNYLKAIFIADDLSLRKMKHVLIHELGHAFSFEKGFRFQDEFDEELLCAFLERWADDILLLSQDCLRMLI